ncbi:MAG: PilZ domain-containing protein [Chloroflexi bacterium]|nr:PilZ domain-containing protein [Chloroflexota bacterium]
MPDRERRKQKRVETHLLTAYRVKDGKETVAGFVRTLNLSLVGVMLETFDPFELEQEVVLDFLMDNNEVLKLRGRVTHISSGDKGIQNVGVVFENLGNQARELLARQIES